MSGKTNKMVNQEGRESYGEKSVEGDIAISQGGGEFVGTDDKFEAACAEENAFDAARAEESTTRARSQRAHNLARHATGTENELREDEEQVLHRG